MWTSDVLKRQFLVATLSSLLLLTWAAVPGVAAQTPKLVDVRTAHHHGFDRIVFEFQGPVPDIARARWAETLRLDPSGKPAHVQGNAYLRIRFWPAIAHELEPPQASTFGPARRAVALPNIAHLVLLGDYEAEVLFGIGLMKKTRILRATRLTAPSRFVLDVATGFKRSLARVYFVDEQAVIDGQPPYVMSAQRFVPRGSKPKSALLRLYAGPTASERNAGLRFESSSSNGFKALKINDRKVARVTLQGPCASPSADVNVADQINPTLRQFGRIDWVKIYDRAGTTLWPWGKSDSVPACLQP